MRLAHAPQLRRWANYYHLYLRHGLKVWQPLGVAILEEKMVCPLPLRLLETGLQYPFVFGLVNLR